MRAVLLIAVVVVVVYALVLAEKRMPLIENAVVNYQWIYIQWTLDFTYDSLADVVYHTLQIVPNPWNKPEQPLTPMLQG